jgi:hypothetical protein
MKTRHGWSCGGKGSENVWQARYLSHSPVPRASGGGYVSCVKHAWPRLVCSLYQSYAEDIRPHCLVLSLCPWCLLTLAQFPRSLRRRDDEGDCLVRNIDIVLT